MYVCMYWKRRDLKRNTKGSREEKEGGREGGREGGDCRVGSLGVRRQGKPMMCGKVVSLVGNTSGHLPGNTAGSSKSSPPLPPFLFLPLYLLSSSVTLPVFTYVSLCVFLSPCLSLCPSLSVCASVSQKIDHRQLPYINYLLPPTNHTP